MIQTFKCDNCGGQHKKDTKNIHKNSKHHFCSLKCNGQFKKNKTKLNCSNCNAIFLKTPTEINKSKSGNHFCCQSCSTSFNNTHKTTGYRRSKIEEYIQDYLTKEYPNLEIHYNRKDAINSELDIYIPSLKLAFELNGIFHYEPIYGQEKLNQIQNNDGRKFQACAENKISLCIINTSHIKYVKEKNLKTIFLIIKDKIIKPDT